MSERQQRTTDAVTIAPRWKHLWCQHGITGGTLARNLACIWSADLLMDSKPYLVGLVMITMRKFNDCRFTNR